MKNCFLHEMCVLSYIVGASPNYAAKIHQQNYQKWTAFHFTRLKGGKVPHLHSDSVKLSMPGWMSI